ncbi:MAG: PqqD family protein [Clostridia bacterium]|nr:PqqD family protein [Clostridia bacterium]
MKLNDAVAVRKIGNDTIAFVVGESRVDLRQILRLNPMAEWLFGRLSTPHTEDELVEAFVAEYGVTAEAARKDISEFLQNCAELGFIEDI